jgi:hypothetical protein
MNCKKLEDFDKENPNYQFLADAIEDSTIRLLENECVALINAAPLRLKFGMGMEAYLKTQGYTSFVAYAYFPQGEIES